MSPAATSSGKLALVTGASSGIGREIALELANRGYRLAVVARRKELLDELAQALGADRVQVIVADLNDPEAPAAIAQAVPEVDVLVNNAGFGDWGSFVQQDHEVLMRMLQVNVMALTALTHLYLPGMVARGSGKVLNVSSTAAFQPGPLLSAYFASKAFVLNLTEGLAEETRGTGVTLTALCPGATASGFQAVAKLTDQAIVTSTGMATAAQVARFGLDAMDRGRVVVVYGVLNRVLAFLPRVSPRPVVRRIVHVMQRSATHPTA